MSSQHRSVDPSRRKALKTLGVASAASVAYPLIAGNAGAAKAALQPESPNALVHPARPLRIGLLLAGDGSGTQASARFRSGMDLYFATERNFEGDGTFELRVETIGAGVNKALAASRTMAASGHVDIAVGFMSSRSARWLHEIFERGRVPFIEANAGERVSDVNGSSPYIFHNTLGMWHAADAAGDWAAHALGRTCVMVTSFAESGYDTLHAFRNAFQQAGGTVLGMHVLDGPQQAIAPDAVAAQIKASGADFIYLASSGTEAARLGCALQEAGLAASLPVVTSNPEAVASGVHRSISVASWYPALPTRENREFTAAYRAAHGVEADMFALLGYDTARMIAEARRSALAGDRNILRALRAAGFMSPRGPLTMDAGTHTVRTPLYLRDASGNNDLLRHDMTATLAEIRADHPAAAAIPQAHGWLTTYACA